MKWLCILARMGLGGTLTALVVGAVGALLRRCRAPARAICLLWLTVCFRLLCPVTLQIAAPAQAAPAAAQLPGVLGEQVWEALGQETAPSLAAADVLPLLAAVYGAGVMLLLARATWKYHRVKTGLALAYKTEEGYYTGSGVATPLVLGLLRPRVYLPSGLPPRDRALILEHERAHIRYKDNWTRPLFYGAACLHWYNPLVWLAYACFVRETEAACDEEVLRRRGADVRGEYGRCLLALAQKRPAPVGVIAFGEIPLKSRVAHILGWKRPDKVLAVMAFAAAAGVGFACMFTFEAAGRPADSGRTFAVQAPSEGLQAGAEGEDAPGVPSPAEAQAGAAPDGERTLPQDWLWPVPAYRYVSRDMVVELTDVDEDGNALSHGHKGVDVVADKGSEILAMADGVVESAGYEALGEGLGYGYLVLLRHADGWVSLVAHCDEVCVQEGEQVRQGQRIARVGSTGMSTGAHCHVEILDAEGRRYSLCEIVPQP